MTEITILMLLLLCKSYEMAPRPAASKGPGGDEYEARQEHDLSAVHAGLAVGFDLGHERHDRPGAVARRAPPARFSGRARADVRPSRRLAFRSRPRLAVRASPGILVPVLRVVVDRRPRGDARGADRDRRELSD